MVKVAVILAQGFEEIEALTVVDVLRRANITCDMVGFEEQVTGSHAIQVRADHVFDGDLSDYDMIVLPGGMPGSAHLRDNQTLIQELQSFEQEGKKLAAICAAPIALNQAEILKNKRWSVDNQSGSFNSPCLCLRVGGATRRGRREFTNRNALYKMSLVKISKTGVILSFFMWKTQGNHRFFHKKML